MRGKPYMISPHCPSGSPQRWAVTVNTLYPLYNNLFTIAAEDNDA